MFKNILVPLDGSPASERAAGLATNLAKSTGARVTLMQAVSDSDGIWTMPYDAAAIDNTDALAQANIRQSNDYLNKIAQQMTSNGVANVSVTALRGAAAETICALASNGYDLIVMNTHGRTGMARAVLGSVTMAVVRASHLPVLLVNNIQEIKDYASSAYHFDTILVPLDGSEFAEQAIPSAVEFAKITGGKLLLLKVLPGDGEDEIYTVHDAAGEDADYILGHPSLDDYIYLENVTSRYIHDDISYTTIACTGRPAQDIIATTTARNCSLIVMTTHARAGLRRIVEGSVTETVIASSPIPVLALRGLVREQQPEVVKVRAVAAIA